VTVARLPLPSGSDDWLHRDAAALAPVLKRATDLVIVHAEGSWLFDAEGRRYLDFTSGIGATSIGHCHPHVVEAVTRQARHLMHTSIVAHHERSIEVAELLRELTPFIDDPLVFLCNSGAEAVDGSLKLVRRVTGRSGVVAFRGGFHGRTLAATSLTTSKDHYREGYKPLLSGVAFAPYPTREVPWPDALDSLDAVLSQHDAVGAMIVEPVLGEGGYIVPPVEWLRGLRERCTDHGIVLIFDEVQCGVGRTGAFWGAQTFGVAPDVLLFAKGIASGMPLGGIVAGRELMERWPPGAHGSTFGGNPVSCAAAVATIEVIEEDRLCGWAIAAGRRALATLRAELSNSNDVKDVRGVGLMIGIELADGETCTDARHRALSNGLVLLPCGSRDEVLRLIPPLNVSDDELDIGLAIVAKAVTGR
jgi:4-aminobutyrate aminotransferase